MHKQFIKGLLRRVGLIQIADKGRYLYQRTFNNSANTKFIKENPELLFPTPYLIYESHKLDYKKYYYNGRHTAQKLLEEFEDVLKLKCCNILDWGCGPARVVRHLSELAPHVNFYGSDYNKDSIAWNKQHIKNVQFSLNSLTPPMHFRNELFDGIYGLSVLTHLSKENHYKWVIELSRILKCNGILIITTHGAIFKERLLDSERRMFNKGKLVVQGKTLEGHRTYAAFQPPEFMRYLLSTKFEVLKHIPGIKEKWGLSQDKWILKKKT